MFKSHLIWNNFVWTAVRKRTESQYLLLPIYLREFNTVFINFKERSRVSSFLCAKICQIYILTDIKLSYLTFKPHSFFFCLAVFNFLRLRGIMFPVELSGKICNTCMLQRFVKILHLKIIQKYFLSTCTRKYISRCHFSYNAITICYCFPTGYISLCAQKENIICEDKTELIVFHQDRTRILSRSNFRFFPME